MVQGRRGLRLREPGGAAVTGADTAYQAGLKAALRPGKALAARLAAILAPALRDQQAAQQDTGGADAA